MVGGETSVASRLEYQEHDESNGLKLVFCFGHFLLTMFIFPKFDPNYHFNKQHTIVRQSVLVKKLSEMVVGKKLSRVC